MSLNILYISTLSLEHVDLACVFIFVMLLDQLTYTAPSIIRQEIRGRKP